MSTRGASQSSSQGLRLLVADDDEDVRDMLEHQLSQEGYAVEFASNGLDAWMTLVSQDIRLAVLDWNMPGIDGVEICRRLRELGRSTYVIILTSEESTTRVTAALDAGASDYIVKPWTKSVLLARVNVGARTVAAQIRHERDREDLRDNEERQRVILDTIQAGVVVVDKESQTIVDANTAALAMIGVHRTQIVGRPFKGLICSDEAGACPISGLSRKIYNSECTLVMNDGRVVPVLATLTPVTLSGRGRLLYSFIDIAARKQAEDERKLMLLRQQSLNQLQQILLAPGDLGQRLKRVTDYVVDSFDADFCRIWITKPGDYCESGCIHAGATEGPHVCRRRDRCLHLMASSGSYTHLDGEVHRRVPFGCYKIGRVAADHERKYVTNDAVTDPWVHDHEWARKLGLVSCAGFQLRPSGGETIGVLALFSKRIITSEDEGLLESLANTTAQMVQTTQAEEALQVSEARYRSLYDSSDETIMIMLPGKGFISGNAATLRMFGCKDESEFVALSPVDLSPEYQPDGALSSVKAPRMIGKALEEGSHFFEWTHKRLNGEAFPATVMATRMMLQGQPVLLATVRDVTDEKRRENEVKRAHSQTRHLLESIPSILICLDEDDRITAWNATAEETFGIAAKAALGCTLDNCGVPWDAGRIAAVIAKCRAENRAIGQQELRFKNGDGRDRILGFSLSLMESSEIKAGDVLLVAADITEQKALQVQFEQTQKLESIGQLAAGIAHEINTPTQFVSDNTRFLQSTFPKLQDVLAKYELLLAAGRAGTLAPELLDEVDATVKKTKLKYLLEQIPEAISDSLDGLQRVATIVRAMKDFSHPGQREMCATDLNKAIESTITVARNEWKYVAEMVLELDPELPPVYCMLGDFNQVILNIVVNAAHAIAGAALEGDQSKGTITISSRRCGAEAEIRISDTGTGIPEEHRAKVFDHFFTTKEVGKGTGQGLSIAHTVITKKHGGKLTFETEIGKGTTFIIRLPFVPGSNAAKETPRNEEAYSVR